MRMLITPAILLFLSVTLAFAVPAGRSLVFKNSPSGAVKFDGDVHNRAVASCKECHNEQAFPKMKQGTVAITMEKIYAGQLCGICHNGKKAFEAKANCQRCHGRE